jgi:hypothetical protein
MQDSRPLKTLVLAFISLGPSFVHIHISPWLILRKTFIIRIAAAAVRLTKQRPSEPKIYRLGDGPRCNHTRPWIHSMKYHIAHIIHLIQTDGQSSGNDF